MHERGGCDDCIREPHFPLLAQFDGSFDDDFVEREHFHPFDGEFQSLALGFAEAMITQDLDATYTGYGEIRPVKDRVQTRLAALSAIDGNIAIEYHRSLAPG